jgi:hydrogenase maturation protein HypF
VAACDEPARAVVRRQVDRGLGCVSTTSVGRLFDVVASVLGVRQRAGYEAQAAMELEARAERGRTGAARLTLSLGDDGVIDPTSLLADLVTAASASRPAVDDLALAFHHALADVVAASVARVATGNGMLPVALTGGVFQNAIVSTLTRRRLEADGHVVLTHRLVPPNDGGLSLGQAVVAGRMSRQGGA